MLYCLQVVEGVRAQGELNFDYVALILLAGMIAALGLMDNSLVSIIAAMLVSPLMVSSPQIFLEPIRSTDDHRDGMWDPLT